MKPPRFIQDLYADLRDRKLLPLVIVLLLAMVAVPVLLKSDTEPPPPVDPAAVAAALPDEIPTAAVAVSNPGLRDYRERLDSLSSKNPFAGDAVKTGGGSKKAQVEDVTEAAEAAGIPVGGGGATGGETTIDESVDSSTSTTESVTINDNTGSNSGNNNNNTTTEPQALAFRVDVEVGPAGDLQRRKNVKLLTVLPSQSNPVFLYLGASEDGKHAVFLVSDDVTAIRGDGRCVPTPADCQFLNMKKGDEMRAEYAPNGEADTFVLEVLDISLERNNETADADRDERDDKSNPTDALKAWLGL